MFYTAFLPFFFTSIPDVFFMKFLIYLLQVYLMYFTPHFPQIIYHLYLMSYIFFFSSLSSYIHDAYFPICFIIIGMIFLFFFFIFFFSLFFSFFFFFFLFQDIRIFHSLLLQLAEHLSLFHIIFIPFFQHYLKISRKINRLCFS